MKRRRIWLIAIFLFVMGDGLTLQTRGPLMRSFQAEFLVTEGLLGLVAPAGTVGFVVAVLVIGLLAGRINLKRWTLIGVGLTGVSLLLMSGAPVYWLFLVFLVAQGTATGVFRGIDRPILSHLYPRHRGRAFMLHSLAWAVGAVFGPIFVNWILGWTSWRVTYLVLGLFFLPLFVLLWRVELPTEVAAERDLSLEACRNLLREPVIVGMVLAIGFVGALEGIVFTWFPFYASEFIPLDRANLLLSVYLMAYIPSRICYSWLVGRVPSFVLVTILGACAVPVIFFMVSGITGVPLYLSVGLAGFFVAGFFPLISTFGVDHAPEYSGPISAMATAATYLGLAIGPLIIGFAAETVGIVNAMRLTTMFAIGMTVVLVGTWLVERRLGRGIPRGSHVVEK